MARPVGCATPSSLCLEPRPDESPACRGVNDSQTCAVQNEDGSEDDASFLQSEAETSQEGRSRRTKEWERLQLLAWLRFWAARECRSGPMCEKHQEPLNVFCKEDRALVCLVCHKSKTHRNHTVLPAEEAAEDFKVTLQKSGKAVEPKDESGRSLQSCCLTCRSPPPALCPPNVD